MIAAADPIECATVNRVAPLIQQRAVVPSVHRDFAVTVKLSAHDPKIALPVSAQQRDVAML